MMMAFSLWLLAPFGIAPSACVSTRGPWLVTLRSSSDLRPYRVCNSLGLDSYFDFLTIDCYSWVFSRDISMLAAILLFMTAEG